MIKQINVLHIISQFAAGGIEKWLMDLHQLNTNCNVEINHHFLCISGKTSVWDTNINSPIYYSPNLKKGKFLFLFHIFKYSPYVKKNFDIVHIHLYRFSAFIAFIFWVCRYKNIIVHAHNDKRNAERRLPLIQKIVSQTYGLLAKAMFKISAKISVAASKDAADDLFGSISKNKTEVIFCGIKLANYKNDYIKAKYIREFSSSDKDFIFTNIGSLTKQKNHEFLIDVFEKIIISKKNIKLFIIGDGPLFPDIVKKIEIKNLSENIFLLGNRNDALSILQNFSSAFVFPSIFEGLGLALIEAQYSGNHCFISQTIPNEATIEPDLITRLELDRTVWEREILNYVEKTPHPINYIRGKNAFSIENSAEKFTLLYEMVCKEKNDAQ